MTLANYFPQPNFLVRRSIIAEKVDSALLQQNYAMHMLQHTEIVDKLVQILTSFSHQHLKVLHCTFKLPFKLSAFTFSPVFTG